MLADALHKRNKYIPFERIPQGESGDSVPPMCKSTRFYVHWLRFFCFTNLRTTTLSVRARFAPSPTGYLHVGGLRTALYNYLYARKNNGAFVLRIEDTDRTRYVEGAVESLIETLRWAGLEFDEGPGKGGAFGPYVQSERIAMYQTYAKQLVDEGKAYYAFDTPGELEEMRRSQEKLGMPPRYDRRALKLSKQEVADKLAAGVPSVVRMKIPGDAVVAFDDHVRGRVEFESHTIDDQVLLKSDGYPTYHLANVVDDHLMHITHVIRGEEWLSSTPKHVLLYRYFDWELPQFAHLPLLLNPDKSKLSKRQGDVAVEDYRAKGYLKEALVNFVAFLGWNPGDEREIFSLDELVKEFSLERVGKAGAVFNVEKLNWMNFEHLRRKPDSEVLTMLKEHLKTTSFAGKKFDDAYLLAVIGAMRDRATFVRDFVDKSPYFFEPPQSYDPDVVKKRWKKESSALLQAAAQEFSQLQHPGVQEYEAALHRAADGLGVKNSEIIHPLRLAVSGTGAGPGLYDVLSILGQEEVLKRITSAIDRLQ
jgi:glutamyl-tRNA synthetase